MKGAWVTLATNDSYSLGALVLAHSLKQVGTAKELAILITPGVTNSMKTRLSQVFNLVQEVNILDSKDQANLKLLQRPELGITFTKLHCWRLTQYEKCVFLDADTLVLQNCDELFEREELSAAPDVGWPDCFNSGVFVYRPSSETYDKLTQFALDKGSFDGGDQGLLNLYFHDWAHKDVNKHLPFIYNVCSTAFYSYLPAFKQFGRDIKIIHFIGNAKPWLQYFDTRTRKVCPSTDAGHLTVILQKWWDLFCNLIHPELSPEMSGLAGAFAQLTLGQQRSPEQEALENSLRRQNWEMGNIDYLGRDSFENIWNKICDTLSRGPQEENVENQSQTEPQSTTPVMDAAATTEEVTKSKTEEMPAKTEEATPANVETSKLLESQSVVSSDAICSPASVPPCTQEPLKSTPSLPKDVEPSVTVTSPSPITSPISPPILQQEINLLKDSSSITVPEEVGSMEVTTEKTTTVPPTVKSDPEKIKKEESEVCPMKPPSQIPSADPQLSSSESKIEKTEVPVETVKTEKLTTGDNIASEISKAEQIQPKEVVPPSAEKQDNVALPLLESAIPPSTDISQSGETTASKVDSSLPSIETSKQIPVVLPESTPEIPIETPTAPLVESAPQAPVPSAVQPPETAVPKTLAETPLETSTPPVAIPEVNKTDIPAVEGSVQTPVLPDISKTSLEQISETVTDVPVETPPVQVASVVTETSPKPVPEIPVTEKISEPLPTDSPKEISTLPVQSTEISPEQISKVEPSTESSAAQSTPLPVDAPNVPDKTEQTSKPKEQEQTRKTSPSTTSGDTCPIVPPPRKSGGNKKQGKPKK